MQKESPAPILLKDYQPTPYVVSRVELDVVLRATESRISSRIYIEPRGVGGALKFHGEELKLHAVSIDGSALSQNDYVVDAEFLTIHSPPQKSFTLEVEQSCNPQANSALSGLYLSNGMFCTQMEAEGFRRFAYMYDRPDVMATYRVRVEAPKSLPVLLVNGNRIDHGNLPDKDNHFAIWDDPHPKPTYLFALVGGDLASIHDTFTTMEGRNVALGIYVEKGKEDRCGWAMQSLKASMLWDEQRFGRAYDLDVFNIVAVSDFNMGAMENKGLNIFNDKYVLARPDTATDTDYVNIEAIIAHEYFHNWTGNRITCRDWFQLCLKEGLTVYRDQEFTSDMRSRAVKRISDIKTLRARQYPEDQGPLAHAVRPTSYIEINNFYTPTVYEKGAEICRMLHTLIGDVAFRKAMDIYFDRHDGEAATVEDFIACMAEASGRDLRQFFTWYEQAGTPRLTVKSVHDAATSAYDVTISQVTAPTPGQAVKKPLHMPLRIGLVAQDGQDLPLMLDGKGMLNEPVIELCEEQQTFRFLNVKERPVLSINRGCSAPVALHLDAPVKDLLFLMGHDSDPFNRWEAAQTLGRAMIVETVRKGACPREANDYAAAVGRTLNDRTLDHAFKAMMLNLPLEAEIAASLGGDADADKVFAARESMRQKIAETVGANLERAYHDTEVSGPYQPDTEGTARRSLRYAVLAMMAAAAPVKALTLADAEFSAATSMTAEIGALSSVLTLNDVRRDKMLDAFYKKHSGDPLLVDKWFMLNAAIPGVDAWQRIAKLMQHPQFTLTTPNRVYSLLGGFTGGNSTGFNAAHGKGYALIADAVIALDAINPQAASRIATGFRSFEVYDSPRRAAARTALERILAKPGLSRDVDEIIGRIAGAAATQ
jgi:aminopeptidase N